MRSMSFNVDHRETFPERRRKVLVTILTIALYREPYSVLVHTIYCIYIHPRFEQVLPPSAIGRDIPFSAQRPTRAASPFNTVSIGGGFDNGVVKVADARQVSRALL